MITWRAELTPASVLLWICSLPVEGNFLSCEFICRPSRLLKTAQEGAALSASVSVSALWTESFKGPRVRRAGLTREDCISYTYNFSASVFTTDRKSVV